MLYWFQITEVYYDTKEMSSTLYIAHMAVFLVGYQCCQWTNELGKAIILNIVLVKILIMKNEYIIVYKKLSSIFHVNILWSLKTLGTS